MSAEGTTDLAKFRELAEAMPQLVWTCDADGVCDYLGPQWVEYTGTPAREQLGSAWLRMLHPDDQERVKREWALAASTPQRFDIDFRIRGKDGSYRWFKTRAVPVLSPEGRVVRWLGTNTDIEDLRRAELEVSRLKENLERQVLAGHAEIAIISERLIHATQAAKLGIWDWDVSEDRLVWDEQMHRLYGLAPDELRGVYDVWVRALHPEDKERTEAELKAAVARGGEIDTRFRILWPDGSTRHIRAAAKVYRNETTGVVRALGVNWDITQEVEAQEAAHRAEQRLNLALESTGDGVWDWDLEHDRLYLSRSSNEMVGDDGESVATRNERRARVHPDDRGRLDAAISAHLRGETTAMSCEYRVQHRNGSFVWIHARGRVIARNAAGAPTRVIGTHKCVTERRQAQEALQNREALLREFITHAPAAIAMLDRDLRYLQASRRWLVDYKLVGQNIIGRSHYDVFPEIPQRWKEVHQRALAGAVEHGEEDAFPRADGSTDWLNWEVRPWHESSGEIGGLIFFTQIVTDRKLLGLKLEEQNRQLLQSNAELEQFAYVASHDLQEPLRAIAGCTQLLAQRYRDRLEPDADQLISHIVDGSTRMKALIEDLLRLSRVSTQHELGEVNADQVAERVKRNLSTVIQAAEAVVDIAPLPTLRADRTQLLQLFQNLIGNALKYRREQPPRVEVKAERKGDFYEFSVADNGIGIDARYFERIFGVFQRLHTRAEYPGTGIGLAICRKIVERHGGKIWLTSEPGKGTTFYFTLPA